MANEAFLKLNIVYFGKCLFIQLFILYTLKLFSPLSANISLIRSALND